MVRQPTSVNPYQRHTKKHPCRICEGYDSRALGDSRCWGFIDDKEEWEHCTRADLAGPLTLNEKSGTYAHKLHGLCECGDSHGLTIVPPPTRRTKSAPRFDPWSFIETYDYRDATGTLVFQVCRYDPKDFRQRRPLVDNPEPRHRAHWAWDLKGIDPPLYGLAELLSNKAAPFVFIFEGEKDCNRAHALEILGTTCAGGADKWRGDYNAPLKDRHIVIVPDNDEPGRRHADGIARSLRGVAASIRILQLPGLPEKGDFSDWGQAGGSRDTLYELVRQTRLWKIGGDGSFSLRELLAENIQPLKWLVPNVIPEGLVMLGGKPKMGKSWLTLELSVAIAHGGKALGAIDVEQGDVLYFALEDGKRRLQDRCRMLLRDAIPPAGLTFRVDCPKISEGGLDVIDEWITDNPNARLVVIDTLKRVRDQPKRNQAIYDVDYEALLPLQKLAQRRRITILVVHHFNKMPPGDDWFDAFSGSTGLMAVLDGALGLFRTRGEADAWIGVSSREGEEQKLALQWSSENCTWTAMGDAAEQKAHSQKQKILGYIVEVAPQWCTPREVAEATGINSSTVKSTLARAAKQGEIRNKDGKYAANNFAFSASVASDAFSASVHPAPSLGPLQAPLQADASLNASAHASLENGSSKPKNRTTDATDATDAWMHDDDIDWAEKPE